LAASYIFQSVDLEELSTATQGWYLGPPTPRRSPMWINFWAVTLAMAIGFSVLATAKLKNDGATPGGNRGFDDNASSRD
jgi:hypothetical protein